MVYIIMRVTLWENMQTSFLRREVPLSVGKEQGIGFVPVFATEEEAIEAAKDGDLIVPMKERDCNEPENQ